MNNLKIILFIKQVITDLKGNYFLDVYHDKTHLSDIERYIIVQFNFRVSKYSMYQ